MTTVSGMICTIMLIVTTIAAASTPASRGFTQAEQAELARALIGAGMEQGELAALRLDTLRCYPGAWRINLHGRDNPEYYLTFREPDVLQRVTRFLKEEHALLEREELEYGVPRQVVGAILMIESRLGRNWGSYRVPDLFLSLLLLPGHAAGVNLDSALAREVRDGGERSREELAGALKKRASSRSRWAAKEFLALHAQFQPGDWSSLEGSWAGAMGLPQFLPSSLAAYGADGDGDGLVDLYTLPDAVMSIGNYLRENGWRGTITEERRRKVIRRYNHSDNYVDAVLRLARDVGMAPAE